jgi:hypothetical protein
MIAMFMPFAPACRSRAAGKRIFWRREIFRGRFRRGGGVPESVRLTRVLLGDFGKDPNAAGTSPKNFCIGPAVARCKN